MRWGLALVLLASCGDNIRMVESGSRLEAIMDVGGEGAEALAYFRDRETNLECVFAPDRDGTWRCMPRHAATVVGYSDSECEQPIYECVDCGDGREAILRETGCVVPATQPVMLVDTARPAFIRAAIGCVSASFPDGAYFTATEDDATRFVAGTFDDRLLTEELGVRTLVADDGAHQLHHGFMRSDGRSCTFFGGSGSHCLPGSPAQTQIGLAYFYAEDSCTSRIAISPPREGCEPTTHARVDGSIRTVTRLEGQAFERSAVDSSCFLTEQTDLDFWSIGGVDDTLPTADLIALGGTAPARPAYYAAGGSPLEFARRFVNIDGVTCFSHPTTTAGRRCIPRAQSLFTSNLRFSEPTCTMQLVDNIDSVLYAVTWEGIDDARRVTEDSVVATIHPLRSYPGTDVYAFVGSDCVLLPEPAFLMAYVGLAMDIQKFPSIERRPAD